MTQPARILPIVFLCVLARSVHAEGEWPQFRGPDGQGHSKAEGIPLHFSETKNIKWKTAIPGQGYSSPVIWGKQIWLTSSTDKGKSLHAICVDRDSGKILHDIEVLEPSDAGTKHVQNGYASPTPVLDGERVIVHFGPRGTVCLDTSGKTLWKNTALPFAALQGAGSTPILHEDLVILTCDGTDVQFLAALDKRTGKVRWKQPRAHLEGPASRIPIGKMAYSTPLVHEVDGVPQLVSTAADHVAAYDVRTGKEIWWKQYEGFSLVCRPSFGHGMFFVVGSIKLDHHAVYAVKPGKGKIGDAGLAWMSSVSIPHVPSPLLVGDELFVVHDGGVATCFDAKTGKVNWKKRLGGNFRQSPTEIRGRIYVSNREGKTFVFKASKIYELLATNELDGAFYASPAIAGRAMFLRSETHLYRVEK